MLIRHRSYLLILAVLFGIWWAALAIRPWHRNDWLLENALAIAGVVLAAYGFSAKKDLLAQLLALNLEVAAIIEKGEPVIAPGVPKNFPDAKKLVTEDCIRPTPV